MIEWIATVDWTCPMPPNTATVDEWMAGLEGMSAAISCNPPSEEDHRGRGHTPCSVTLSLEAPSLRRAIQDALRAVEAATGQKATGIEVLTSREFDRRQAEPQIPDLVAYGDIAALLNVSRQRAREIALTAAGFPAPALDTKSGPMFLRASVESWAQRWERKAGRPRSTPATP